MSDFPLIVAGLVVLLVALSLLLVAMETNETPPTQDKPPQDEG